MSLGCLKLVADVVHAGSSQSLQQDEICLFSEKLDVEIHKQHVLMHLKNEVISVKSQRLNEAH